MSTEREETEPLLPVPPTNPQPGAYTEPQAESSTTPQPEPPAKPQPEPPVESQSEPNIEPPPAQNTHSWPPLPPSEDDPRAHYGWNNPGPMFEHAKMIIVGGLCLLLGRDLLTLLGRHGVFGPG